MTPEQLLAQLREAPIPPPPVELDRGVGQRVNRVLTWLHLADFALGAAPLALVELARAATHAALFSLTGRYPPGPLDKSRD